MFGLFKVKNESADRIKKTEEDIKDLENKIDQHVTELAESKYQATQEVRQAKLEEMKKTDPYLYVQEEINNRILGKERKERAIENYKKEIHTEADAELSKIDAEVNQPYNKEKEEAEWQKRFEKLQ